VVRSKDVGNRIPYQDLTVRLDGVTLVAVEMGGEEFEFPRVAEGMPERVRDRIVPALEPYARPASADQGRGFRQPLDRPDLLHRPGRCAHGSSLETSGGELDAIPGDVGVATVCCILPALFTLLVARWFLNPRRGGTGATCPNCHGRGNAAGTSQWNPCLRCGGRGTV
jgi:hypothetical protein